MKRNLRNSLLATTAAAGLAISFHAVSHLDDKAPYQSYRQSYFTLVGMNFGPLGSMVKGEIPWNQDTVEMLVEDLSTLSSMDVSRAFAPGSEKGKTRAKPEIWENMDDFKTKFGNLQDAIATLEKAADSGDRGTIAKAVGETGKACKSCHDEYKAKDYLY